MFTKDNCRFTEKSREIRALIEDYDSGKINLNPWFQRDFKNKIKSSIIESILLGFPLSRIYLMKYTEDGKNKYYVIDGKQRLATIISFYKGYEFDCDLKHTTKRFKCTNFENLSDLNGLTYKDLLQNYQEDFLGYPLSIIEVEVVGDVENTEVLEYIFEKVNTTSKPLTKIEIQNCIYSGKLFEKLKDLDKDKTIRIWFGNKITKNDLVNFLLQFICFISNNYDNKNISNSVNNMLEKYHSDELFADKWIKELNKIFKKGIEIFNPKQLIVDPRPLLKTYLLIAYYSIENLHPQIIKYKDELISDFMDLFLTDTWTSVSTQWTTKHQNIASRIMLCEHTLESLLNKYDIRLDKKRIFDESLKKHLYNENNLCKICNQRIDRIEDAHVDHIVPWSLGGATTAENAQISHRTCNTSKGNKF